MVFYYLLPFLGKEKCFQNHRFIEILLGRHLGKSITHLFSRSELREPWDQEVRQMALKHSLHASSGAWGTAVFVCSAYK